jgi:hypothetical protein
MVVISTNSFLPYIFFTDLLVLIFTMNTLIDFMGSIKILSWLIVFSLEKVPLMESYI